MIIVSIMNLYKFGYIVRVDYITCTHSIPVEELLSDGTVYWNVVLKSTGPILKVSWARYRSVPLRFFTPPFRTRWCAAASVTFPDLPPTGRAAQIPSTCGPTGCRYEDEEQPGVEKWRETARLQYRKRDRANIQHRPERRRRSARAESVSSYFLRKYRMFTSHDWQLV